MFLEILGFIVLLLLGLNLLLGALLSSVWNGDFTGEFFFLFLLGMGCLWGCWKLSPFTIVVAGG